MTPTLAAASAVEDTLEARLDDATRHHKNGEFGTVLALEVVLLEIRAKWATKHPSWPASPRSVRNEGGVNEEVGGGAQVSGSVGTKKRGVIKVDGGVDRSEARVQRSTAAVGSSHTNVDGQRRSPQRSIGKPTLTTHVMAGGIAPAEAIEPQLKIAGLMGFADGNVPTPDADDVELLAEFRAAHLLTFMVISRCCSSVVQIALKACRQRMDAGHQAWRFILSTYQASDDLYIGHLEEQTTHLRMGEQELRLQPHATKRLIFHAYLPPATFTTLLDDVEADVDLPELDPDVHADPDHHLDITTMTVKEALASCKCKAVKAAMNEEIRSLISMGTWELVERPRGVNIMKNWWVLMTKYHINDTVACKKARLVVKGFTQVYGADYDETYALVSSYVTLMIFLSIVAVLDLNLMHIDMKNAFLQSKLDRVLYMYHLDYYDDGTGRVCKLMKSLYGLKQTPLLWFKALDAMLTGADWKKSQVDDALYFKVGDDDVTCWVLVYVDDLLAASSSTAMLKELLEAALELREISPIESQRIKCATLLSSESEYLAAAKAGKEGHRLRFLLAELKLLQVDNTPAITVAEGLGLKGNLKHMEQRYAWLQ
ncbi:unnamed protein product [Closterium sp. NIES-54]